MKKIRVLILNFAAALYLGALSGGTYAELGSFDKDLTYTPVTPCRIVDTRNSGALSGILAAGSTRSFNGPGGNSFASQGGTASDCNLLTKPGISALVINFTVVSPSTGGYMTAFASDVTLPLAATLNFNAGDIKGNNATLKINQNPMSFAFNIFTTSQLHLVADVVGYYKAPKVAALECYKTANSVGNINVANSGLYLGTATAPACAAGYSSAGTNCVASSVLVNLTGMDSAKCDANHFFNTATITASQRCCRVPGR